MTKPDTATSLEIVISDVKTMPKGSVRSSWELLPPLQLGLGREAQCTLGEDPFFDSKQHLPNLAHIYGVRTNRGGTRWHTA